MRAASDTAMSSFSWLTRRASASRTSEKLAARAWRMGSRIKAIEVCSGGALKFGTFSSRIASSGLCTSKVAPSTRTVSFISFFSLFDSTHRSAE